ncbi:M23 family metallopeptidase [Desulfobacula phenolica]|uniref:Murein DD-endopeptidase MepM and murein hydrolase activator NlpD, contain LysM domain n=1 Tax=Desulfobacula phenolica TaxID=90732 RepID=A0A1H2JGA3_9BACT|nr:peptidoglycan DD-metalloendopeptidase family protein [Desulfobacula phenolica]SDU55168.1 Murein DD-endopeptidase MepM and murein hydrolase activator NlpD, contain LysM domain [Desulfobacula phenolica]
MVTKKFVFILFFTGIILALLVNSVFASNSGSNTQKRFSMTLPDIQVVKGIVKHGDTASSLLNKYLPLQTIYEISRRSSDGFTLAHIRKGQPYKIILKENNLVGFEYEIDKNDRLVIQKNKDIFSIDQVPIEYDVILEMVSSTITSSLFEAVKKSGEGIQLALSLSDIFAWDIDFIRDIQPGDQFKILVEKRYRNGKSAGYGQIHAAFFTNNGTLFKAFLHKDSKGIPGYYDENGNSLQKAFLKAPLAFSRISSKFTKKRMHPILKEYRSHPGVDYAAPKGTPIKTVGDGVITQIGYNKGMGNYINIRHYNGYITSYNHMSKFAKGMKQNKQVLQGDVIGYVGMTGYATGPHLDFRMKKNGKLIDPLKHRPPSEKPVNPDEMDRFLAKIQKLSAKILMVFKPGASAKTPT